MWWGLDPAISDALSTTATTPVHLHRAIRFAVGATVGVLALGLAVTVGGTDAVFDQPASVTANVPSKAAYAGSKSSLAGACPHVECPSNPYCEPDGAAFDCEPDGAAFDEEYRITEVHGNSPHDFCALDRDLTLVEFEPQQE